MKTYMVKKDINKPDSQDNWIIMTGMEFFRFMQTEEGRSRSKSFALLESGDGCDDDIIAECGEQKAREWENERLLRYYHSKSNKKFNTVSYDWCLTDSSTYGADDIIADPTADVEATVMDNLKNEILYNAICTLTPQQMVLIDQLFLSNTPMTLKEYAECNGINENSAHGRKARALMRLKKYFEKHGLDNEFFA